MASSTLKRTLPLLLVVTLLLTAGSARAELLYDFQKVVETSVPGYSELYVPSLNNPGQVAYWARSSEDGVYRWNSADDTTTTITMTGGYIGFLDFRPTINDVGQVATKRSLTTGGSRVSVGDGTAPVVDYATSGQIFWDGSTINNNGRVTTVLGRDDDDRLIRSYPAPGSGQFARTIAESGSSEPYSTIRTISSPTNSSDVALINGFLKSTSQYGLFTNSNASLTPGVVATMDDGFTWFGNAPDINDSGQVAFIGRIDDVLGLYLGGAGETPTLVADETTFESMGNTAPSLNNNGDIAFWARVGGLDGIYRGGNPSTDLIIQAGDSLDGGTVLNLGITTHGMNDANQIAFLAFLDDDGDGNSDREAVFFGTQVPEPSTLMLALSLLLMGCIAGGVKRWRHGRS